MARLYRDELGIRERATFLYKHVLSLGLASVPRVVRKSILILR